MFDKVAVSIKLRVIEDDRNTVALPIQQKKRNHSQFAVCLRFLFVFSLDLDCTKHISNRRGVCCVVRRRKRLL